MLKRISNTLRLVLVLQEEHVILLAHYDCHPFPPSVKSIAFGLFEWFVIMGNFVNFFGIFEQALSQDGLRSLGNGYKFS